MHHLAMSCVGTGVGRNYIYSKLGRFLSKTKIAYLYIGDDKGGYVPCDGDARSKYNHKLVMLSTTLYQSCIRHRC